MGKVLFFDIDGTLVDQRGIMSDSTRQALGRAQENGHKIVLCSGRALFQIDPWLRALGFDGIISAAGACVTSGDSVLYEEAMKKEALAAAVTLLERLDASYAAQTRTGTVMTAENHNRLMGGFMNVGLTEEAAARMWGAVELEAHLELRQDIEKLFFFEARATIEEIQKQLSDTCEVTAMRFQPSANSAGEITGKGIHKALGMQKYLEHAGITREDTMAFGDGMNDTEMLAFAHVGVAMGNACDTLKRAADYVTSGIDEDGIARALKVFGLL